MNDPIADFERLYPDAAANDCITVRGDMTQASARLWYQFDDDPATTWRGSVFQTADACHNLKGALEIVAAWVEGQGG